MPSRVVVYLLRAAGLFTEVGFGQVWTRLCAGLSGLPVRVPAPERGERCAGPGRGRAAGGVVRPAARRGDRHRRYCGRASVFLLSSAAGN